jgi:hypothetical protein
MAGYAWIFWSYNQISAGSTSVNVCMFRNITGVPCPSCGTTHSLFYLVKGRPVDAFHCNPLGFLVAIMLIIIPFWIIKDIIYNKNSFHSFYYKSEKLLKKKWVALPAIILVLIIWILNIKKNI